jgi:lipid-binding SYLF domain-containing protein
MKNYIRNLALGVASVVVVFSASTVQAVEAELLNDSKQAVTDFLEKDSTLNTFLTNSAGYAIFPSVGKGGFIVGGARGKGIVYEKTNIIGTATMTQASIGAQVGGQTFAEIIFFETPAALTDFKDGKFEMSAEASAVAAAEGASAAAKYKDGVAVFTLPKKGLMVQASIGGQKFKFEQEALEPTGRPPKSEK